VGEHYLGELTERERRIATGFSGGMGGTKQELCGVFSMGAAVISALYGRTSSDTEDQDCQDLVALYRQRFLDRFGTLQCAELREKGYGAEDGEPCSVLAERGVKILVDVIEAYRQTGKV
jgi:C_GCAxxG_C_C family probable redox protein